MIQSQARLHARIGGLAYLYIIFAGVFAEAFVRGTLISYNDASATAQQILANTTLYRSGLVIELVMHLCDLIVAAVLYRLLLPVNQTIAFFAAALRLVVTSIAGTRSLLLAAPLSILSDGNYFQSFSQHELQALALLAIELSAQAYTISLIFFGVCCLALGYLIFRSTFLPRSLGVMLAFAGACYLINSFSALLAPTIADLMFPYILLPCLIAELALALWMAIVGLWTDRWEAVCSLHVR